MMIVRYVGKVPLEHPQLGVLKPGETREIDDACALALARERGDIEVTIHDDTPTPASPSKRVK